MSAIRSLSGEDRTYSAENDPSRHSVRSQCELWPFVEWEWSGIVAALVGDYHRRAAKGSRPPDRPLCLNAIHLCRSTLVVS